MRRSTLLLALGVLIGTPVQAQSIVGRLLDRDTGQPLSSVAITLQTPDSVRFQSTVTNASGHFSLLAPAGVYRLVAERLGYSPATMDSLVVGGPDKVFMELQMSAEAVRLEGVAVSVGGWWRPGELGGFHDRRQDGRFGTFLTRSDFAWYANRISDVLIQFIGGKACSHVYLDNRPLRLFAGEDIDSRINPDHVEAIEVYRWGDEPIEYSQFRSNDGRCPTILIWTPYALDDPRYRNRGNRQ